MRAALGRNVLANMLNVAAGVAVSLISVPFILDRIGTAGYGVWVLGLTFVLYLTIADAGVGPAVQRWVAVARGRGDDTGAGRLLWTALALYTVIGAIAALLLLALARPAAKLFVDAGALQDDATSMFRLVGVALLLTLWLAALGNVLQGLERFLAITVSSALGSIAYLIGVIAFLSADRGLVGLAYALLIQQAVVLAGRTVALRDMLTAHLPHLLRRTELREVLGFAGKLQVNAFASLVNSQSDKVVVGVVASPATVGELGIASQLVDTGRLIVQAALAPIVSALAVSVGSGDGERLRRQFAWMHRTWLYAIGGGTIIAIGVLYPLIDGWLGGHDEAIVLGSILVAGNGISLLTGTGIGYLRSIGKPGLEARFGPVIVGLNLLFTIPLALAFDARGVVSGTLAAYTLGTIWFMKRFEEMTPEVDHVGAGELVRPTLVALVAAVIAMALGVAITEVVPTGVALLPVGLVAGVAFAGYMSVVTGRRLTPSGLRELAAGLRGA